MDTTKRKRMILCFFVSIFSLMMAGSLWLHSILYAKKRSWDVEGFVPLPRRLDQRPLELPQISCTPGEAKRIGCPSWFLDYLLFHRQMRGKKDAKYLVYSCKKGEEFSPDLFCGGLGDRLNGIFFLLRLAHLAGRVFLIDWDRPAPLEFFFEPAAFDWRVSSELREVIYRKPISYVYAVDTCWDPEEECRFRLMDEKRLDRGKPVNSQMADLPQVLFMGANTPSTRSLFGESEKIDVKYLRCLVQGTFKPSPTVLRNAETHISNMFGAPSARYAAVHLRLGGAKGETNDANQENRHGNVTHESVVKSAMDLVYGDESIKGTPILLMTDNPELQARVQAQELVRCKSTQLAAVHLDKTALKDPNEYLTTFVEFVILSKSAKLFWGASGFSSWAAAFGRQDLHRLSIDPQREERESIKWGDRVDYRKRMGFGEIEAGASFRDSFLSCLQRESRSQTGI
uniref:O-fucosyltransferase family protein n=1 Tax=Chromera velia CCMP2878 TaxID=1169474 RepID=A0A0G4F2X5_9ALVE|eukprot:Cvel_14719.t1-p1 / transcript=Cvel_14719.t1 / gene=Cvel_14719 / organism=Chromera_velia_CCMP2878 / gene_product=hypothetical protein / transcript_product=hypothetical protein / location=Cvel_scaffold1058:9683-12889(-) / protein_length=455 / sequence_SO=supercontig / SO=protein_coding / is_pseudo=false